MDGTVLCHKGHHEDMVYGRLTFGILLRLEEGGNALSLQRLATLRALEVWLAHGRSDREPLQFLLVVRRAEIRVLPRQGNQFFPVKQETPYALLIHDSTALRGSQNRGDVHKVLPSCHALGV